MRTLKFETNRRVLIIKAEGVDVSTASLAEKLESTMQTETNGGNIAVHHFGTRCAWRTSICIGSNHWFSNGFLRQPKLAIEGHTQIMVGWRPYEQGEPTQDPRVCYFCIGEGVGRHQTAVGWGRIPTTKETSGRCWLKFRIFYCCKL